MMKNIKKDIKSPRGSITLFVLISIMFFIIILTGIYISSNNKVQQREKEIEKIQEEYKQKNINDIYEETKASIQITNIDREKPIDYVTDGLIAHFDGIYNTRSGNNPDSTVWEDLSNNMNDAIGYNIGTENGYYSEEENGYVFLENSSYFKTINNIGISGDDNYTIEAVFKPYMLNTNYTDVTPIWFGVGEENWYVGGAVCPTYNWQNKKAGIVYINNIAITDESATNITSDNIAVSWSKIRAGQLSNGDTDHTKITINGQYMSSTYGVDTTTVNIQESQAEIGRSWQYQNDNRTADSCILSIRVYNRALTDEEIENNYQIDKYRFDIE